MILVELPKTFNCLSHELSVCKFEDSGLHGIASSLVEEANRLIVQQIVKINTKFSDCKEIMEEGL